MNLGATILSIETPDRDGRRGEITMRLASPGDYIRSGTYAGATLGPTAGRIGRGHLPIGDTEYTLDRNDGENTLHGGTHNFSRIMWNEKEILQSEYSVSVVLSAVLADGTDGFPGERTVEVRYTLEGTALTIGFVSSSTRKTWLTPSNHTFFNLSGNFEKTALGHLLEIQAGYVLYNNRDHLPAAYRPVAGTPFDFRQPVMVQNNIDRYPGDPQIENGTGFNNAYDIRGCSGFAVSLHDPESGRFLKVATDYPAVVFYSGGYLGSETVLAGGSVARPGCALVFEAQQFPDAVHLGSLGEGGRLGAEFLESGKLQRNFIRYQFGTA